MKISIKHGTLTVMALAWVVGCGYELVQLSRAAGQYTMLKDMIEANRSALIDDSHEDIQLVQDTQQQGKEIDFLQSLVQVLPQEKGFARTQNAISEEVEQLRRKVGYRVHNDLHILVDTRANKLYLKRGLTLLWEADCSVGKGGQLIDHVTGRRWEFVTPHGQFEVQDKYANPVWHKPDWAFVENHEPIPPPGDPKRNVPGELGAYVFNLGDGYLIHGTLTESLLGHPASHGCVRLGADNLKKLYATVPIGTRVYIY